MKRMKTKISSYAERRFAFFRFFPSFGRKKFFPEKSFSGGSINWKRLCACERLPHRLEKLDSLSMFGFLLSRGMTFSHELKFYFYFYCFIINRRDNDDEFGALMRQVELRRENPSDKCLFDGDRSLCDQRRVFLEKQEDAP